MLGRSFSIELKSVRDHHKAHIKVLSIFKCLEELEIPSVWEGERIMDGSLKLETLKMGIEGRLGFCQRGYEEDYSQGRKHIGIVSLECTANSSGGVGCEQGTEDGRKSLGEELVSF